ncbi:sigma-54-dependent Fis family transcriptional regulator [bacterium]|nr:sigma-54-dependent Fis family transcriptional regulator [bacterium]
MTTEKILVVDDRSEVRDVLQAMLEEARFGVEIAIDGENGLRLAENSEFAVAIVDQNMPGISGIEMVRHLKELTPDIEVIVYTGYASLETSIAALQQHAFDYIQKPAEMQTILRSVHRAAEHRRLVRENRALFARLEHERDTLRKEVAATKRVIERRLEASDVFIGYSPAIRRIRRFVADVASSDITVLLLGESGVGKDVVARLIHESSGRDPNAFVKINCPAIPETLLESELFGHEPGAFTGADRRKPGRFELASGGTVFLDEIGDLPMSLQAKLLEFIEQRQFTRLGGGRAIHVDVRIVAATNVPIRERIDGGAFRADLFYRLNEYAIHLPTLRERNEDIPLLVDHFLNQYGTRYDNPGLRIPPETMDILTRFEWPGNVRELEAAIRRFALDGDEETLIRAAQSTQHAASLPIPNGEAGRRLPAQPCDPDRPRTVKDAVEETEVQAMLLALRDSRWNQRKAAGRVGMSYSSFRRRVEKYGLKERLDA